MNTPISFTEVLGFSQSYQWYAGQPIEFPPSDPTFKLEKMFLATYKGTSNCQARFGFGGDLTKWKDLSFIGYEGHISHNITKDRNEITRLIFNVSGEPRKVNEWKSDIETVVEILLSKYLSLQELYLQPIIGGVDENSNVRAVKNQPKIVEAIQNVVSDSPLSLLRIGSVVQLGNEDFSDMIGHLTFTGAQKARKLLLSFYDILSEADS